MNKVIQLKKDLPLRSILARAKREANEMVLVEGIKHTICFNAPLVSDLIILELKNDKWNIRSCNDNEWGVYFYKHLYNRQNKKFVLN